jgi:hypothetical protein
MAYDRGPLGLVFSVDFGIIGTPAPPWREIGGGCIAIAEFTAQNNQNSVPDSLF